jgi:hypothetical protein
VLRNEDGEDEAEDRIRKAEWNREAEREEKNQEEKTRKTKKESSMGQ